MQKFELVEEVRKHNLSGVYSYYLERSGDIWKVSCYEVNEEHDFEFQWEVFGKTVGYKNGNVNWPITEPFTEETAREEFARWK